MAEIRERWDVVPADHREIVRHLRDVADAIEKADGRLILLSVSVSDEEPKEPGMWEVLTVLEDDPEFVLFTEPGAAAVVEGERNG